MPDARLVLVYCGEDSAAAKVLTEKLRSTGSNTLLQDSFCFDGVRLMCDDIFIMPDVPEFKARLIREAYGIEKPERVEVQKSTKMYIDVPPPEKRKPGRPRKEAVAA